MSAETRRPSFLDVVNLRDAREFSYKGLHVEAIDYVCLFRTEHLTVKAYFFDHGSNGEMIVPHTHRYSFDTRIVTGQLTENRFAIINWGEFNTDRYEWRTPIDGGEGMRLVGPDSIRCFSRKTYTAGHGYYNRAHADIHALSDVQPGTIAILTQFQDVGSPVTLAWSPEKPVERPYVHMERHDISARLEQLQAAMEREAACEPMISPTW